MGDKNIAMARKVAEAVDRAGGRTYYVGGCVRDWLLGRENKDIDIEVHGVSVKALEGILDALGKRTAMGASFGIMGLRHYDLDIAMPRSERATGRGHKDFEVFVDPYIGAERAALRRDFTMNALMQDVITGEILDFFGGRADMEAGRIRHVNDVTFAEDPLRVFRAAQFAARFGFVVAKETAALSAAMAVDALASERVMGELEKALLKASRPSVFFNELKKMNQLSPWFAELGALPEDAWQVTMTALDAAAVLRGSATDPLCFLLAALCAGLDGSDAGRMLKRLTSEARVTRYALNMTGCHRTVEAFLQSDPGEAAWMALYDGSVCPEDLILLERALHVRQAGLWPETEGRLRRLLALYCERIARPYVMGRDLVEAGVRPGPCMGQALKHAHELRLSGATKAEQLEGALALVRDAARTPEDSDAGRD